MKKSVITVLLSVTFAFAAFVGGFYMGMNTDRTHIHISGFTTTAGPSQEETKPAQSTTAPSSGTESPSATTDVTFPINLNTATLEQLDMIPGIGPVLAQRILDYRAEIGSYTSVEELLDVKGIGEKTLENILEYITV